MIQRLAITVSGIAAAVVLTVGLVAAGFAPGASSPAPADPVGAALDARVVDSGEAVGVTAAQLQPEVVYVKPASPPETIVVEERAARRSVVVDRSAPVTRAVRDEGDDREDHDDREDGEDREDGDERDGDDD